MHVLFIPKWYPGRQDPQLGDFLRKQAEAASSYVKMSVLVIEAVEDNDLQETVETTKDLWELRIPYRHNRNPIGVMRKLINLRRYLRAANRGQQRIWQERGKPDLTHAYIMTRPALVAWLFSRKFRIPYIIGEQSSEYLDGTIEKKSATYLAASHFFFRRAKGVTAVSRFLGDQLIKLGFTAKYDVAPNVIPGLDRPLPPRVKPGQFLMVADLVDKTKNVSGVLNALHIARQTEPGLRLSVIGDGPDRDTLQKLAASKGLSRSVAFLGRLPNTGVLDHMATVSAVIINSRVETFSVVTGEALAQGKPVIATRCGGPMAFVEPGNGILIDIDDDNALAQAMIKITHDAESYDPIKIRAGLSERFSPSVVGETLAKIYTKALND